jgi:hypothetical protein
MASEERGSNGLGVVIKWIGSGRADCAVCMMVEVVSGAEGSPP